MGRKPIRALGDQRLVAGGPGAANARTSEHQTGASTLRNGRAIAGW